MKFIGTVKGILFIVLIVSQLGLVSQEFINDQVLYPTPQETPLVWSDMAVDGEYMVLGAASSSKYGTSAGQAFVYQLIDNEWVLILELQPTEYRASHNFGKSVDIQNDHIVVATQAMNYGGPKYNEVYVYKRDGLTWTNPEPIATLSPSVFDQNYMGESVRIKDNVILAGDADYSYTKDGTSYRGMVYVFEKSSDNEWADMHQTAELNAPGVGSNDFGNAMALNDNLIGIGVNGKAFFYEKSGALWESSIQPFVLEDESASFGADIRFNGDHIFVSTRSRQVVVYEYTSGFFFFRKAELSVSNQYDFDYQNIVKMSVTDSHVYLSAHGFKVNDVVRGGIIKFSKGTDWQTKTEDGIIYPEIEIPDYSEFGFRIGVSGDQVIGMDQERLWTFDGTLETRLNTNAIQTFIGTYETSYRNYFGNRVSV